MLTRFVFSICLLTATASARAQAPSAPETKADREAVRRVALDYIDGFYEGDTAKLVRALRPDMWKYGFWRDTTQRFTGERMAYSEALAYARQVKARNRPVPATWAKDVQIYEVQGYTAAAKVTAWWGTDYLLIGKYDGKWMISSILWQSPPAKSKPDANR